MGGNAPAAAEPEPGIADVQSSVLYSQYCAIVHRGIPATGFHPESAFVPHAVAARQGNNDCAVIDCAPSCTAGQASASFLLHADATAIAMR